MARKRTELLQVRLTPEEKQLLDDISEKSRIPVSVLVRAFVFSYLADIEEGNPKSTFGILTAFRLLPVVPKLVSKEDADSRKENPPQGSGGRL